MSNQRTLFTANLSEKELKHQGDRLFKARKFGDAIKSYSAALNKNPTNYKHLMDRAMCYEKLKQWELFVQDWRRALDLKAHMLYAAGLMMGARVLETKSPDEATKYLQKAHEVAKRQVENNSKEIALQLELTRKKHWIDLESKEIEGEKELLIHMSDLIKGVKKNRLSQLKKYRKKMPKDQFRAKKLEIREESEEHNKQLGKLFGKLKERRRSREIPDYLLCPISFELFKNPVITPCGITYERKSIVQHLEQCGSIDPVTRLELTEDQLIPNRAIMNAVDSFVAQNEWARYE